MSGVNRLVQVFITAVALAVGTGAAVSLARYLWGDLTGSGALVQYGLLMQCLACFVGSTGFCMLLNLHGSGMFLCIVGGIFSLLSYRLFCYLGVSDLTAFFLAAALLSVYSEIMARVRKYPATSYLLVALFPLVPRCGHLLHHGLRRPGQHRCVHSVRPSHWRSGGYLGGWHSPGFHGLPHVGRLRHRKKVG